MPTSLHKSLVQTLLRNPDQLPALLKQAFGLSWPEYVQAQRPDTKFERIKNIEYFADGVLTYHQEDNTIVAAVVIEAQLAPDPKKQNAWLFYVSASRLQFDCPVFLVVVTPTADMAKWASRVFTYGHPGLKLRPLVIGPAQTAPSPKVDPNDPAQLDMAVLQVLLHGNEPEHQSRLVDTLIALTKRSDDLATMYLDAIVSLLRDDTAQKVIKMLKEQNYEYTSKFVLRYYGEGKEEGLQEGKREGLQEGKREGLQEALIILLESKKLLTEDTKTRILAEKQEANLHTWIARASTTDSLDEVFRVSE